MRKCVTIVAQCSMMHWKNINEEELQVLVLLSAKRFRQACRQGGVSVCCVSVCWGVKQLRPERKVVCCSTDYKKTWRLIDWILCTNTHTHSLLLPEVSVIGLQWQIRVTAKNWGVFLFAVLCFDGVTEGALPYRRGLSKHFEGPVIPIQTLLVSAASHSPTNAMQEPIDANCIQVLVCHNKQ